jgi:transketolase
MKLPVIYLFTHDSIFVGEDGPTHQPIEQLESLRLIPNLRVIRPASGAEVKLAWQTALKEKDQPVALVIARQAVDLLPADPILADFDQGAYLVTEFKQAAGKKLVSILASGSEVATAVAAAQELAKSCNCRVISVPEKEKLYSAPAFLAELLADSDLEVAVEAGSPTGWYRLLTGKRLVIGIEEFGYSAAGAEIADYFGLTSQKIAAEIKKII